MTKSNSWFENAPRIEDFEAVLRVCELLEKSDNNITSLREIASNVEEPASTLANQIRRVVNYLIPPTEESIRSAHDHGLGRASLFNQESAGQKLALTKLGALVRQRITMLREFLKDFQQRSSICAGKLARRREVRIGGPQTIVHRLLANAFSEPDLIHREVDSENRPILNLRVGNTYSDLIPRLRLGQLDFVVGYGDTKASEDLSHNLLTIDPDIQDSIGFESLGFDAHMVLMSHPNCKLYFKHKKPIFASSLDEDTSITPELLDFRETPLIAVPSWRQPARLQALVEEARRLQCFHEVEQFDDALALVRANCGVAIIGQAFSERRGVRSFQLTSREDFSRPIGLYFRKNESIPADAQRYWGFLKAYVTAYRDELETYSPGPGVRGPDGRILFPSRIEFNKDQGSFLSFESAKL